MYKKDDDTLDNKMNYDDFDISDNKMFVDADDHSCSKMEGNDDDNPDSEIWDDDLVIHDDEYERCVSQKYDDDDDDKMYGEDDDDPKMHGYDDVFVYFITVVWILLCKKLFVVHLAGSVLWNPWLSPC